MNNNLETEVSESWLKRAFKEEWPTMFNHLVSAGGAMAASAGTSYMLSKYNSDAAIVGVATAVDNFSYWAIFLPQLLYRDKDKLKNQNNQYSYSKIAKKAGEYLSLAGMVQVSYSGFRFFGQYLLQKEGWDPASAALTTQASATALFTFMLPITRFFVRQWSEK